MRNEKIAAQMRDTSPIFGSPPFKYLPLLLTKQDWRGVAKTDREKVQKIRKKKVKNASLCSFSFIK